MVFRQLGAYCGIVGGLATFDTTVYEEILFLLLSQFTHRGHEASLDCPQSLRRLDKHVRTGTLTQLKIRNENQLESLEIIQKPYMRLFLK